MGRLIEPLGLSFEEAVGRVVGHRPVQGEQPIDLAALMESNKRYRKQRWPEPFDKTTHRLVSADARSLDWIDDHSVHLVVTSPPYWT